MIKEGLYLFKKGEPVQPFKGKYSVRVSDVFDRIDAMSRLDASWRYQPLRVEFELTTKCNDSCPHCGMGAADRPGEDAYGGADRFRGQRVPGGRIAVHRHNRGEPFLAFKQLLYCLDVFNGVSDVSKLTTNGFWGTERLCERTVTRLVEHGLLRNRLFVPLLMVSIGEQSVPLDRACRIVHYVTTRFSPEEVQVGVSSLKVRGEMSRFTQLKQLYAEMYGPFPDDLVHSTLRTYLVNERLSDQAPLPVMQRTSVTKWMGHCYECFTPTVGAYVLPTALLKFSGDFYTCAAFNVPEKLGFGNIYRDGLLTVLARANGNRYVQVVHDGGGLRALGHYVSHEVTDRAAEDSYCDSCRVLIDQFEART